MDVASKCIRCGSTAHSTRQHDEGKIPGQEVAAKSGSAAKKPAVKKNATGPTDGVKSLFVHHDQCWQRTTRSPGIPDVVEPPFRMQVFEDPCIASWQSRDDCLCKQCEKKRKKTAFVAAQKKRRAADKGRAG